jgi:hypothetical protein
MYTAQGFVSSRIASIHPTLVGLTAPQAKTVAELLSLLLVERSFFIYTLHYKLSKQVLSHGLIKVLREALLLGVPTQQEDGRLYLPEKGW